jgi:hypothetical protein
MLWSFDQAGRINTITAKALIEMEKDFCPGKPQTMVFSVCELHASLESATSKTLEHVPHHSLFAAHGLVTHTIHPT